MVRPSALAIVRLMTNSNFTGVWAGSSRGLAPLRIRWPPRSGRRQSFPEVDRAEWFDIETARTKMLSGQVELLDRFLAIVGGAGG
jgi:predicted NUDIX family NTP pyrophosphohydrolase